MIKSDLADTVVEASESNYTQGRRGHCICKITPHHMAGVLSATQCGRIFQNPNRQASSNYGIGYDGEIACYVGEENRAWTSSNRENDCQAITIEVSNSECGGDWPISDEAWNSLVNLCVDICRRYDFRLDYDGTPNGSLTRHNMFANTNCPGPYLESKFPELAETVNRILDGEEPAEEPTDEVKGVVADVQRTLNERYCFDIAVDNIAGSQTKGALVRALQIELNEQYNKGVVVDGIFGNQTKGACITLMKGAKGNITWIMQARLACLGYDIVVDGDFGSQTDSIVRRFQRNKGTVVDGIIGKITWGLLFK